MNKRELLTEALSAREDEVIHYQINIDNYERAIEKATLDPDLTEFVSQLSSLLQSSSIEQKKAKIMLEVIKDQLEDLP